jgi:hypothetical protein
MAEEKRDGGNREKAKYCGDPREKNVEVCEESEKRNCGPGCWKSSRELPNLKDQGSQTPWVQKL